MNDFEGLLSNDYGFKPQGKAAPMAPPRSNLSTGTANSSAFDFDIGGSKTSSYPISSSSSSAPLFDDHDTLFRSSSSSRSDRKPDDFSNLGGLENVFSGSSKSTTNTSVNLDSIFSRTGESEPKFPSLPVFDKPVYDEDVFDGVSGMKSSSSSKYEDIFSSASPPHPSAERHDAFDELLGGLGRKESDPKSVSGSSTRKGEKGISGFDELLPGFGSTGDRASSDRSWVPKSTHGESRKASTGPDDPFVVLNSSSPPAPSSPGFYSDPLEQISKLNSSSGKKAESFSSTGVVFDDLDPLGGFGKSVPVNNREKSGSPVRTGSGASGGQNLFGTEESERFSYVRRSPERVSEKKMPTEDYHESSRNIFDIPSATVDSDGPLSSSSPSNTNPTSERTSHKHTSGNEENLDSFDDVWLSVSEIPLYTQPTVAPPPSRPPPPKPPRSKAKPGSFVPPYTKKKVDEYPSFSTSAQVPQASSAGGESSFVSPIDELEDFAKVRSWSSHDGNGDGEALDTNSVAAASAAAMKEAMDKAEARFRHAKGVRERENAKSSRVQHEKEDRTADDYLEREYRERQEKLDRERQERLERERMEREEEERRQREEDERMRTEREREREEREKERRKVERDLARQAMERATREARERAAIEARSRAEKAAVEKVHAEARGRAERAAVLRAQAEARERAGRAAAEAKQKSDREKAEREARERAEREARERAEREAKEKEIRDKAARASQQRNEDDLESFFGGGSRASSAPRPRASTSFQSQQSKPPESARSSVGSAANMRKASSSTNIVDDLSSIFGAAPSAGDFPDIDGETEERRRARLERHQRTQERAAKALAEKNQRDLDVQKEQAERHRIAETLDIEIKRWAAGKEGNLRALLSTMQYVLWPECGWQPVSLTDLINAAQVKKVYRKATLCIHPDKVQQKGANLQQKYIAEKVFDLLKEAWNKFNSEELF